MPIEGPVLQFAVLIALVLVVQLTVERLHLPALLGLLVAGMLLGPGGLDLLPREPVVELLGEIGLVYLMFMAAVEIDLDLLREQRNAVALFGVLAFACSLIPALAMGYLLGYGWAAAILLGALISSHTLIAYPIVRKLHLQRRKPVVSAVGGTLITDTLALVLLIIVLQARAAAGDEGGGAGAVMTLSLLAALVVSSLWAVPRLSRLILRQHGLTPPEKALYVLTVLVGLSAAAELIGAEKILGAFLAGVCLNPILNKRDELRNHVDFAGHLLFIPFFFVSMGMLLEVRALAGELETWGLAAALLVIVVAGKAAAAWIVGAMYGYALYHRGVMIGLTIPQAAATLAIVMTGYEAGLFEQHVVDAIVIVIFVSCLAGPLIVRYAVRVGRAS
jgi:Kef-type K+ transport system membrane component KefB